MNSLEEVQNLLTPVKTILRVPDNLIGILIIANRLIPVLRALETITDERHKPLIGQCLSALEQVIDNATAIAELYPEAGGGGRKILKGYYASHPHYCVFWHVCLDSDLERQYAALLVSMFAVQMRLDHDPALSGSGASPNYMIGLSLRQLTDCPNESLRAFLLELPLEPVQPPRLLEHFESLMSRLNLKPLVTGPLRNLGYLYRALKWFTTGVWEVEGHEISVSPVTHSAARHGAIDGSQPSRAIFKELEVGDGLPDIDATEFFEDDGSTSRGNRDQDFSPPGDGARRGTLITVAPKAASAANRVDRRTLARNVARYTAQAITLANQQLPITHATLSGYELNLILKLIDDLDANEWDGITTSDRPYVAAWLACRLFLSRAPEAIKGLHLRIPRSTTTQARGRGAANIMWTPSTESIWLAVESPKHVALRIEGSPQEARTLPAAKGFQVQAPETLSYALQRIKPHTQEQVFARSYENECSQLLTNLNLNQGTALSPDRLGRCLTKMMAQLGGNERVFEFYFRGLPPNQHNPCVYSSVPISRLQALYRGACAHLYRLAGRAEQRALESTPVRTPKHDATYVGSLHVPTRASVRNTVLGVCDSVRQLGAKPGTGHAERHNTYTAYVAFFLLATTGLRGVSTLLPAHFDIDDATGLCFVSDKDSEGYQQARIVWLHPMLLEQLEAYTMHLVRLRQYLALVNPKSIDHLDARLRVAPLSSYNSPSRSHDTQALGAISPTLFLLTTQGSQPTPTFPSEIQHLLGSAWQLRLGALRHFVRTELMHRGVPGPVINAALGHGERGEAPWDRFSSLPPLKWQQAAGAAITAICDDMGFQVLKSPLLRNPNAP